jgi:uncharacterized protein (DUF1501 family)
MLYSRREFLKAFFGSTAMISVSPASPALWAQTGVPEAGFDSARILVVVQLAGGNDGLNTIVPYADDEYARSRTTLRLNSREIWEIDDYLGFHPAMESLWRLYQDGFVSVIQGVGYSNSPRSHPTAMQDWHTANPGAVNPQRGWLGRVVDENLRTPGLGKGAAFVGEIEPPFILNSKETIVSSLRTAQQLVLYPESPDRLNARTVFDLAHLLRAFDDPLVDLVRQQTVEACRLSRRIEEVINRSPSSRGYPGFELAENLKTVAQLIKAETGFSIYVTELGGPPPGGFDTHANQRDNHAALLRQLSDSITAFAQDLQHHHLLDQVALITYSEFGRTLLENGRRGTGHGAAAPILMVGGKSRGGLVGKHPNLLDLDDGALRHQIDFRSVYATLLRDWLEMDSVPVLGREFKRLDLFTRT